MDPITAWALAVAEVCKLLGKIVDGQPLEVRQRGLDWFIAWDNGARKVVGLPEFKPPPLVLLPPPPKL